MKVKQSSVNTRRASAD